MARSRLLPHLSDYLLQRSVESNSTGAAQGFGCLASLVLSSVVSYGLYVTGGGFAGFFGFFLSLIIITATLHSAIKWITKPRNPHQMKRRDFEDAVKFLSQQSQSGRLRRILNPNSAAILEAASIHWARIHSLLESHKWKTEALPLHWKQVRENTRLSSSQAMEELILMLQPISAGQFDKQTWQKAFEYAQASIRPDNRDFGLGGPSLPPVFHPAIATVEKMERLAQEFENVTYRVSENDEMDGRLGATSILDTTLEELRALQKAEEELNEDRLQLEDR